MSRDNVVEHDAFFPASGAGRATFTDTAKVTMTDLVTGVVYTGHSTFQKSFRLNPRSSNSSFTRTMIVKGSDGSTIHLHETGHFTLNARARITVSFDKVKLTCR